MDASPDLLLGLAWLVVFLFSTTVHEAAHALVAHRLGDPTAYHGGQVSLDPMPHLRREPIGMLVVPILSFLFNGWMFGWASAPYDPRWADRHPHRAAWMALAGPVSNLLLALLAALLIKGGEMAGWLYSPDRASFAAVTTPVTSGGGAEGLATVLSLLFTLNLLLFALNLLPLPPLDGSSVAQLFMTEEGARRYQGFLRQPGLAWAGILVAWWFFGILFNPLFTFALNLLYPGAEYGVTP